MAANHYKLPCPYCRGKGFTAIQSKELAKEDRLEPLDIQILRSLWQFIAIHLGLPSADDIAEMLGSSATARLVTHRLRKLRGKGFLSGRGGLRMVPNLAHFLDWNIELPEENKIVIDLVDRGTIKPSPLSFRTLLARHARKYETHEDSDE